MIADMSDEDLLARMKNFEDQFVERKTCGDNKDWLKTVVAFANSAPVGLPCILFIGVRDNGEIEARQTDFDSLQKSFNRVMLNVYPRAAYFPKIIHEDGKQALAVIVPGSDARPHFSGPSYVRKGSETIEASEGQYEVLIACRNSKVYKIMQYIRKPVTVINRTLTMSGLVMSGIWPGNPTIIGCNEFWVTLQIPNQPKQSFTMNDVELNYDDQRNCLKLEVTRREL